MTTINAEVTMTLDDAVAEVLGLLTGLDLTYNPEYDRYRSIARQLNRALRSNALEKEWGYYSDVADLGAQGEGTTEVVLPSTLRARIINDDAARLVDEHGHICRWAYVLPRDAIHKYRQRAGLWVAYTRSTLQFNRPLNSAEGDLDLHVPVMREPTMFRLPAPPTTSEEEVEEVPEEIRLQPVDFCYPDVVILRAAFYYAQSDPVMQPRVQTLEAQYKDLMYQIIERDERATDSPYQNEFFVPVSNDVDGPGHSVHWHPHSDERR
jgi:hypothetical protein